MLLSVGRRTAESGGSGHSRCARIGSRARSPAHATSPLPWHARSRRVMRERRAQSVLGGAAFGGADHPGTSSADADGSLRRPDRVSVRGERGLLSYSRGDAARRGRGAMLERRGVRRLQRSGTLWRGDDACLQRREGPVSAAQHMYARRVLSVLGLPVFARVSGVRVRSTPAVGYEAAGRDRL